MTAHYISAFDADGKLDPAILDKASYEVAGFKFDPRHGVGAVPDVANIAYMGAFAAITPAKFLSLIEDGPYLKSVEYLKTELPVMGPPFLDIRVDLEKNTAQVFGHEGRARMTTIGASAADQPIPVALFISERFSRLRHRHIEPEMLDLIQQGLWSQAERKPKQWIEGPIFDQFVYKDANQHIVRHSLDDRKSDIPFAM